MTREKLRPISACVVGVLGSLLLTRVVVAIDCSVQDARFNVSQGSYFDLTMNGFSSFDVQTAINYWSGCSGYGPAFPTFEFGGTGGVPVSVARIDGRSTSPTGSCGRTSFNAPNGTIEEATITVWTQQSNGDPCEPLTDVIAHEFGHVLGLADAPDSSCMGHIMGARLAGGSRSVQSDDCDAADSMWRTSTESFYDPYCEAYCPTYCTGSTCEGHPSPILLDLENDGVHLTGLNEPVWFDIDANGTLELLSWTNRSEAFLALDRNGNGKVDNGGELFGNLTHLSSGALPLNGYQALADLDSWVFGGNGDGHLDAVDPAFSSLLLWTDRSHDGISQPEELQTAEQAGIRRIDLEYRRSRRTDRYGNLFAFAGRAWKEGPHGDLQPIVTWDVYFSQLP